MTTDLAKSSFSSMGGKYYGRLQIRFDSNAFGAALTRLASFPLATTSVLVNLRNGLLSYCLLDSSGILFSQLRPGLWTMRKREESTLLARLLGSFINRV